MTVIPDAGCLFCKIIEKKIPARIVFEDLTTLVFEDIHPQAPIHILIVPKKHIPDVQSIKKEDEENIGHLFLVANLIAKQEGMEKSGYRLVVNAGRGAGQTVFHLHLHLLSGRVFSWPPG